MMTKSHGVLWGEQQWENRMPVAVRPPEGQGPMGKARQLSLEMA